jgi:hypothetical protein
MAGEPKNTGQLPSFVEITLSDYLPMFDADASAPNKTVKVPISALVEFLSEQMLNQTIAQTVRVLNITSTDEPIPLGTLIDTALTANSTNRTAYFPTDKDPIQVSITPRGAGGSYCAGPTDIAVEAPEDVTQMFPVLDALDTLRLIGDALSWDVVIFFSS